MSDAQSAPRVVFNVLGPLEVRTQPGAPRLCGKPATLLALLLLHGNSWVTAKQILDALWGQNPPASADRNVKTYIWQLRRALPPALDGAPRLHGKRGGYLLQVAPQEVDATVMEEVVRRGRPDADAAGAARELEAALKLWRGSPFPELPEEMTRLAMARLEQVRWQLRDQLAEALIAGSRFLDAVALLRPLTAEDPLREGLWTRLVLALNGAGLRAEALSCFQSARRVLIEELGVEPGPALQEAHRRALAGETSVHDLLAIAVPQAETPRPSFLPRDVPDFVGRDHQMAGLHAAAEDAVDAAPIVVVEGMPGIGKTALTIHAAHQLRDQFEDGQVFCDLHGHDPDEPPAEAVDLLGGLLQAFGVPAESVPDGLERRAALWRSILSGKKILLVLDDAVSAAQVQSLLPGCGSCLVIITSRRGMYGLDGVRLIELEPLTDDQALELLAGGDNTDSRVHTDREASLSIVRLCGNLPAAIRIAASRLQQHPYWNPSIMARRLAPPESRLGELRAGDRDVSELLATSYDQLSAVGQHVFRVLATATSGPVRTPEPDQRALDTDSAEVWRELHVDEIETLSELPSGEVERTLEHLLDHHLVTQFPQGHYGMHVLLRQFGVGLKIDDAQTPGAQGLRDTLTQPA